MNIPHVTVKPDQVVVWGMDSLGMERRIFDDIYTVLGRSGNFDGTTPGQFGLGRAAYVTISDHMLLETHSRNGDRYTVLGVEGRGFQVGLGEPDIPFGTRVTMSPRDGSNEFVTFTAEMAHLAAGRCEIPITITTEDGAETPGRRALEVNGTGYGFSHPDVEFTVGLKLSGICYTAFLCGIPISFKYRGSHDIEVSLDIRDERKYAPTPDRERMTEEVERAISDIIDREVDRRLAEFPSDVGEAMEHPDRELAYRLRAGPVAMYDSFAVYAEHTDTPTRRHLGSIRGSPVLECETFSKRRIGAVLAKFPNAVFIEGSPGIMTITRFMREHGIRPLPAKKREPKPEKETAMSMIHTADGVEAVDPENPPPYMTILRAADRGDLNRHSGLLRLGVALTVHHVKGSILVDVFTNYARRHEFETQYGTMTGQQLLDADMPVRRTTERRLLAMMGCAEQEDGGPPVRDILVHDDGTDGHYEAYNVLAAMSGMVSNKFERNGWDEASVEAYLRLESPVLRHVMREFPGARSVQFCREFLESEGKYLPSGWES